MIDLDRQAQEDHVRLSFQQQRAINGIRADKADRSRDAFLAAHKGLERGNRAAYRAAMKEIDRILDEHYGAFRGDPRARILEVITTVTRAAFELAVLRSQQFAERAMAQKPELLAALKEWGKRNG